MFELIASYLYSWATSCE